MANQYDVIILTESRFYNPQAPTPYIKNVLKEDQLVLDALQRKGLKVKRLDWADPHFDWADTKAILFRTTWDYFYKFDVFSDWLERVSQQTQLINPAEQIYWNLDKHYLLELQEKQIHIPPSHFVEKDTATTLQRLHHELGWTNTVLKPAVSGGGRHTYKLTPENYQQHEAIFQELLQTEAWMLQPFQKQIETKGEISLIFFGTTYSHAILKKAKAGDFRVQDDFGGSVHEYEASETEITFARNAIEACPILPTYARVDLIWDNEDKLALSELELIEPELWFRHHPPAADIFANLLTTQIEVK